MFMKSKNIFKKGKYRTLSVITVFAMACTIQPPISIFANEMLDTQSLTSTTNESGSITVTGFDELDNAISNQKMVVGADIEKLVLPNNLKATSYTDDSTKESSVSIEEITWQPDRAFDGTIVGKYLFNAILPVGYTLADKIVLPQIIVVVENKDIKAKLGVPYSMEDTLTLHGDDGCSQEANHIITGSTNKSQLLVESGTHYITMDNATLDLRNIDGTSPFELQSKAQVQLALKGKNVLIGGANASGIFTPAGTSLTIFDDTNGSLAVEGGINAAGIGSNSTYSDCGMITIKSGSISAFAGKEWPMAIGGNGANITINGGAIDAISTNGTGIGGEGLKLNLKGGTINVSGSGSDLVAPSGRLQPTNTTPTPAPARKANFKNAKIADNSTIYNQDDVKVIQRIYHENGLKIGDVNDPSTWGFIEWSQDFNDNLLRVNKLMISNMNLTGNIDVSGLPALSELYCVENDITELNVKGNSELMQLVCNYNELTSLDLTGLTNLRTVIASNNKLTKITTPGLVNMVELRLEENNLEEIDLSDMDNLLGLSVASNEISRANMKGAPKLMSLDFTVNKLTEIDLSKNTKIETLFLGENELKTLDLSGMDTLDYLNASNNKLTSVVVNNLPKLSSCFLSYNQLTKIDLSASKKLNVLEIAENFITNIDLTDMNNLISLNAINNKLTTIDIKHLEDLRVLMVDQNKLANLDITNSLKLENLSVSENNLRTLNLSNLNELISLSVSNNYLTSLDLSGKPKLKQFECVGNYIENLDLTGLPELDSLLCGYNKLTTLNLSGNPKLQLLSCSYNLLTNLDLSRLSKLKSLQCSANLFTSLEIKDLPDLQSIEMIAGDLKSLTLSNLPSLLRVTCSDNALTSLNLFGLPVLQNLNCNTNKLTSLDLSGTPLLRFLDCRNNLFASEASITGIDLNNLTTFRFKSNAPRTGDNTNISIWSSLLALSFGSIIMVCFQKTKRKKEIKKQ